MTDAEYGRRLYCMSCGEEVPTYRVEVGGHVEVRCAPCGYTLEKASKALDTVLECIMLADDEMLFRSLLSDLLVEEHVTREVVACESGPTLLTECVRRIRHQRPMSLILLDILMAPMDGPAAALGIRALEKGFDLPAPVPILFLSAVRADDNLRQIMQGCAPACYLNKGKDAAPPRLARRLKEIVPHLISSARRG